MMVRRARGRIGALVSSLVLAGASLSAALVGPPPVAAALPGASGLIVWQRNYGGNTSQIWVMNPDGSNQHELTSLGSNWRPSWSPDGSKIVFVSNRGGTGNADVYVMNADGSNQHAITTMGETWAPRWSPDGTRIVFAHFISDWDIWVMNADGSNPINVTNDPGEDIDPSWRVGTSTIAFRRGGNSVATIDVSGTGLTTIAANAGDPDWAPDGASILFYQAGAIVKAKPDGTGAVTIDSGQADQMPAWSPDGKRIVVSSHRNGIDELFVMNADGTGQTRLTTGSEDWYPSWQPLAVATTPTSHAFGDVAIGHPSAGIVVTATTGLSAETFTGVAVGGPNPADFDLVGQTCTDAPIPAFGACTATVRFDPLTVGEKTATLTFTITGVGTVSVPLTGNARTFVWGPTNLAGPQYTWNDGGGLAQTVSGSTTFLHAIYVTDRINGGWANDTTRKVGAYYIRSSNDGTSWTAPIRLDPTTQQGSRAAIASAGADVYAVWVSTTKWIAYSGSAPRVLYLRRNTNHGSSSAWGTTIGLTSTTGRVDYPSISATGAYVYVAYTDSSTGSVRVDISADHGAHWKTVTVGSTSLTSSSGRNGFPTIASSGSNVGVAWIADQSDTVTARVSTTNGSTWGGAMSLGTSTSTPSAAAAGTRIGFAWTQHVESFRIWDNGTWQPDRVVPPTQGHYVEQQLGPALALAGSTQVAVVYPSCTSDCTATNPDQFALSTLMLRLSFDDGVSWQPADQVGTIATSHRMNDTPSIVWPTPTKPYVLWNGWTEDTNNYRLYERTGF
jgi:Tol biopolymer transport system component